MQWDYAFDMGSESLKTAIRSSGEIETEAALAAFRQGQETPFAWGDKAYAFVGREAPGMSIRRCVSGGIPEDIPLFTAWVRRKTGITDKNYMMKRRRVLLALSPELSEGSGDALMKSIREEGIETVGIVPADFADALGAGVDIMNPDSCFILHIGASRIFMSAMALGKRVKYRCLPYGMERADLAVTESVRARSSFFIGKRTAKLLKQSAYTSGAFTVAGLDAKTGLPAKKTISSEVLTGTFTDIITDIVRLVRDFMVDLPVDMGTDIMNKGIILTGGGSAMEGLAACITQTLNIPAVASQAGGDSVIVGLTKIMKEPGRYTCLLSDWQGPIE